VIPLAVAISAEFRSFAGTRGGALSAAESAEFRGTDHPAWPPPARSAASLRTVRRMNLHRPTPRSHREPLADAQAISL
jgi:hypothetical protein